MTRTHRRSPVVVHTPPFFASWGRLVAAAALTLVTISVGGCGPSSYDLYIEGLKIEGDAERNVCRLVYDEQANAHILSSDKISVCLERNREALEKYEQAERAGQTGKDFQRSLEDARDRVARLESMLRTVRSMERR